MTAHNKQARAGALGLAAPKSRMSFAEIKDSIAGREEQILDALRIPWESKRPIRCPFVDHDDQNPSWRWDSRKSKFYCSCGHGDVFDIVARVLGISTKKAARWVMDSGYIRIDPQEIRAALELKKSKLEHARIDKQIAAQDATASDQRRWAAALPVTGNGYSQKKGLFPLGCRQDGHVILAPLTDSTGTIRAVEYIYPSGDKRTIKGAATAALSYKVGKIRDGVINVCEGVADAWAVHDMTGEAVAAARGTGNLPTVVHLLADQFPKHRIVVWADADAPGIKAVEKAQKLVDRLEVIYPDTGCKDPWETWHARRKGNGACDD